MFPCQLIFVIAFFGTSCLALEEENSIQVNPPRRLMIAILVPVDRNTQSSNENVDKGNENIENSTGDGKKKILMEVGHPKNDKLNFNPEGVLDGEKENINNLETMTNRKRRSHMHHLGGGCLGGCGIGGGYIPGGGIGGGEMGGHGGQSGSFSTAQSSSSSSSWSEGGGGHHNIGYGKK